MKWNEWKQKKIKLIMKRFLKDKCLGFHEWNFNYGMLSVRQ